MLYLVEVPQLNYMGDGVFFQQIYIEKEDGKCPTFSEVVRVVTIYHERDSEYVEYTGGWLKTLEVLSLAEEQRNFPVLFTRQIQGSEKVDLSKMNLGLQSISIRKIRPFFIPSCAT